MKKRYILYIALALGLAYLVYYRINENKKIEGKGAGAPSGKSENGKSKDGNSGPSSVVSGIIVSNADFNNDLEVTGVLEANESVVLKSEVSGLVTGIFFKEGSLVNKGALLVKINDKDIQAQLKDVLTKQKLSSTNEDRAKQLLAKGAISQEEYDISLADLRSFEAQAQLIRAQLAKTSILAPFSGKIGLRNISNGVYLTPATVIANLVSTNPIKISFSIPEKYVGQIKIGTNLDFTTDGSNKINKGKVYAIEPGINTTTRTLQIKAIADNANNSLLPGSFSRIKLALTTVKDAILVPSEAVIPILNGKIVYVTKNGLVEERSVEAGTRTDEKILITAGLSVGDTVLTSGSMAVKKGSKVKVLINDK